MGSLAHMLLEKGWEWDGLTIQKAARVYGEKSGVLQPEIDQVVGWVEKVQKNKLIDRAKSSKKVFRELPITGKQEDGTYVNAVIDLAFLEEDGWVVVDYKTDKDIQKNKEKYAHQLRFYSDLLIKIHGKPVKETYLIDVRNGKEIPVLLK